MSFGRAANYKNVIAPQALVEVSFDDMVTNDWATLSKKM